MNAIQWTPARRITVACVTSIATIVAYFYAMTRGIAARVLIGLPGRVADVVALQREARYGIFVAVLLQFLAAVAISPLVPPEPSDDHGVVRRAFRFGLAVLLSVSVTAILGAIVLAVHPQRRFTGYPPSVYMNSFLQCPSDGPCIREDTFSVDRPHGCCIMLVTNGDGRGTDEVRSYDIFLNGERELFLRVHKMLKDPLSCRLAIRSK